MPKKATASPTVSPERPSARSLASLKATLSGESSARTAARSAGGAYSISNSVLSCLARSRSSASAQCSSRSDFDSRRGLGQVGRISATSRISSRVLCSMTSSNSFRQVDCHLEELYARSARESREIAVWPEPSPRRNGRGTEQEFRAEKASCAPPSSKRLRPQV
jgi:hypothetical protein